MQPTSSSNLPVRAGSLRAWAAALRPRSLPVAVSPVLVGAAFGVMNHGAIDLPAAVAAMAASLLMQLITNLQNDVGCTLRGADGDGRRIGLPRATAEGWLTVAAVRRAVVAASLLAACLGGALLLARGWPVLVMGAASLLAALAYMGGPRPIAYTPFGELTVFVFFGGVAVLGTEWLLTGRVGAITVLAAVAMGSLAAAALAVNNHRDAAHDREVGRHTFAVCFGETASRRLFGALLLGPFLLLPALALSAGSLALLMPCLLLPAALRLRTGFAQCEAGTGFNQVLFKTFRLGLGFAVLLAAGALLAGAAPR